MRRHRGVPDTCRVSKFMFGGLAGSADVRVFNPVVVFSAIAVLLLLSTAAFGGVLDPTSGADEPNWWPGVGFVLLPVLLAVRGVLTGVVVTDCFDAGYAPVACHGIRCWGRTKNYSGMWHGGSQSRLFRMLAIKTPRES
jgi:hypothetical protein